MNSKTNQTESTYTITDSEWGQCSDASKADIVEQAKTFGADGELEFRSDGAYYDGRQIAVVNATSESAYDAGYAHATELLRCDQPGLGQLEEYENDDWDASIIDGEGYNAAKILFGWDAESEDFLFGGDYNRGARAAVADYRKTI